jgi:hypothetical protein
MQTAKQIAEILPHVRYEIEQCFCIPRHDPNDPHIRESVFLAMLIHARLLVYFFEQQTPKFPDDVLCSHFGFAASQIPIPRDDRLRLDRDIAHLTYSRLRHTQETKPWPIEAILNSLHSTVIRFVRHIVESPPGGADAAELDRWQTLYNGFTGPAQKAALEAAPVIFARISHVGGSFP